MKLPEVLVPILRKITKDNRCSLEFWVSLKGQLLTSGFYLNKITIGSELRIHLYRISTAIKTSV